MDFLWIMDHKKRGLTEDDGNAAKKVKLEVGTTNSTANSDSIVQVNKKISRFHDSFNDYSKIETQENKNVVYNGKSKLFSQQAQGKLHEMSEENNKNEENLVKDIYLNKYIKSRKLILAYESALILWKIGVTQSRKEEILKECTTVVEKVIPAVNDEMPPSTSTETDINSSNVVVGVTVAQDIRADVTQPDSSSSEGVIAGHQNTIAANDIDSKKPIPVIVARTPSLESVDKRVNAKDSDNRGRSSGYSSGYAGGDRDRAGYSSSGGRGYPGNDRGRGSYGYGHGFGGGDRYSGSARGGDRDHSYGPGDRDRYSGYSGNDRDRRPSKFEQSSSMAYSTSQSTVVPPAAAAKPSEQPEEGEEQEDLEPPSGEIKITPVYTRGYSAPPSFPPKPSFQEDRSRWSDRRYGNRGGFAPY